MTDGAAQTYGSWGFQAQPAATRKTMFMITVIMIILVFVEAWYQYMSRRAAAVTIWLTCFMVTWDLMTRCCRWLFSGATVSSWLSSTTTNRYHWLIDLHIGACGDITGYRIMKMFSSKNGALTYFWMCRTRAYCRWVITAMCYLILALVFWLDVVLGWLAFMHPELS